jgi:hypothetical protein
MDKEEFIYQLVCGILLVVSLIGFTYYLNLK